MNATSNLRDLVTLLHEGGHAVHNFVTRDLLLNSFKNPPAEVAELASMSMELLTMDYWNVFFDNEEDLRRAKIQHLESIIETLPWVATIDKFQHWLYENPAHSVEERQMMWLQIYEQFSDSITDWSSFEDFKNTFGKSSCTFMKCRFIISNTAWRSWEPSAYGGIISKTRKRDCKATSTPSSSATRPPSVPSTPPPIFRSISPKNTLRS